MNNYSVECFGFRCNLSVKDITLYNADFPDTSESRNKMFNDFFYVLKEKIILETNYLKRKYILIYKEDLNSIVHCQIARKSEVVINKFNNGNITEKKEENFPYVNVFFDLVGQKIIIEVNTNVFDNVDTCRKVIGNIMTNYFKDFDIIVDIHPITEESDFRKCFDEGKISKVTFELNVPNWGNAASAAKELADDSKNMGAEKVVYTISNKSGNIVYNEGMESFVKYVSDGAGVWKLIGKDKNGNKFNVQSEEKKKKLAIDATRERINEELDEVKVLIIKDAFNKIETIERLKINYE